ncbi:MAG: hypothetical protein K0R84_1558 [Clostridia bacterium]|jgi:hypothetical protein|nr:hypothetical protein [Clostridia bacterium]
MIIIYNCYGGTHSSILTSAVHLGKLPSDRIPSKQEILNTEYFNKLRYKDMGRLIFHGIDELGNKVYTIGRGTSRALVPAMRGLTLELHKECNLDECFAFVNTSGTVPPAMTMGGFFSRGLKIHSIGVPLLAIGARQTYMNIVKLADKTKQLCREKPENCLIIDMDQKGHISTYNG